MPNYRRWYVAGGTYFFTVVTSGRRGFLTDETSRQYLREAFEEIRERWSFEIVAAVLLPDHLHAVWTLPPADHRYSARWRLIKEAFTRGYLNSGGIELPLSASRTKHGERGVWQRRFWEHTVRDEDDLKRCVDYIHYNPKKHRHVTSVQDWPWSSFHRFVSKGEYDATWGAADPTPGYDDPEWGE